MANNRYIDFAAIEQIPNKYGFTLENIKTVKVLNWEKLKTKTWYNQAMHEPCWCHLEGCNESGKRYDDSSEFWIGFYENGEVDCHCSAYEGMCRYYFDEFYNIKEIENRMDMQMQLNTIRYLNMLVDEAIISTPEK